MTSKNEKINKLSGLVKYADNLGLDAEKENYALDNIGKGYTTADLDEMIDDLDHRVRTAIWEQEYNSSYSSSDDVFPIHPCYYIPSKE